MFWVQLNDSFSPSVIFHNLNEWLSQGDMLARLWKRSWVWEDGKIAVEKYFLRKKKKCNHQLPIRELLPWRQCHSRILASSWCFPTTWGVQSEQLLPGCSHRSCSWTFFDMFRFHITGKHYIICQGWGVKEGNKVGSKWEHWASYPSFL